MTIIDAVQLVTSAASTLALVAVFMINRQIGFLAASRRRCIEEDAAAWHARQAERERRAAEQARDEAPLREHVGYRDTPRVEEAPPPPVEAPVKRRRISLPRVSPAEEWARDGRRLQIWLVLGMVGFAAIALRAVCAR